MCLYVVYDMYHYYCTLCSVAYTYVYMPHYTLAPWPGVCMCYASRILCCFLFLPPLIGVSVRCVLHVLHSMQCGIYICVYATLHTSTLAWCMYMYIHVCAVRPEYFFGLSALVGVPVHVYYYYCCVCVCLQGEGSGCDRQPGSTSSNGLVSYNVLHV